MPVLRARKNTEYVVSDDDLDELEEEEEAEAKPNVGPLDGCLSKPRHSTMNTKQLHDMIHTGMIDLDPEYQRDVVWPESKMLGLIQSLFMNYYVPPLIFAISSEDLTLYGEGKRVAIDGKQRCTTLLRFMDGEIPFISPATKEKFWYRHVNGRGKVLPKPLKDKFDLTSLSVVEYDGISDQVQRDIFQRVQMGVPLSAAEKLQAVPGPWTRWISELYKKYVQEPGTLAEAIRWDVSRGRPFQVLASIVILAWHEDRESPVTATMINTFLQRTDNPEPRFRKKMETMLAILVNIATEYYDQAFGTVSTTRVAPVEIWFTGLLIYRRMRTTPIAQLAKQIGIMRVAVRAKEVDLRTNTRVCGTFFKYLGSLAQYKLKPGESPAAAEVDGIPDDDDEEDIPLSKKRKRNAAAREDSDPDYRGPAIARGSRSDVVGNTRLGKQQQREEQQQQEQQQPPTPRETPTQARAQPPPESKPRTSQSASSRSHIHDDPGRPQLQTARPAPSSMDAPASVPSPVSAPIGTSSSAGLQHGPQQHGNHIQRTMSPADMAALQYQQQQQYHAMMRAQQQHQPHQHQYPYQQHHQQPPQPRMQFGLNYHGYRG